MGQLVLASRCEMIHESDGVGHEIIHEEHSLPQWDRVHLCEIYWEILHGFGAVA
jgi:hypothetical protein